MFGTGNTSTRYTTIPNSLLNLYATLTVNKSVSYGTGTSEGSYRSLGSLTANQSYNIATLLSNLGQSDIVFNTGSWPYSSSFTATISR
jgi:hypothetical protein